MRSSRPSASLTGASGSCAGGSIQPADPLGRGAKQASGGVQRRNVPYLVSSFAPSPVPKMAPARAASTAMVIVDVAEAGAANLANSRPRRTASPVRAGDAAPSPNAGAAPESGSTPRTAKAKARPPSARRVVKGASARTARSAAAAGDGDPAQLSPSDSDAEERAEAEAKKSKKKKKRVAAEDAPESPAKATPAKRRKKKRVPPNGADADNEGDSSADESGGTPLRSAPTGRVAKVAEEGLLQVLTAAGASHLAAAFAASEVNGVCEVLGYDHCGLAQVVGGLVHKESHNKLVQRLLRTKQVPAERRASLPADLATVVEFCVGAKPASLQARLLAASPPASSPLAAAGAAVPRAYARPPTVDEKEKQLADAGFQSVTQQRRRDPPKHHVPRACDVATAHAALTCNPPSLAASDTLRLQLTGSERRDSTSSKKKKVYKHARGSSSRAEALFFEQVMLAHAFGGAVEAPEFYRVTTCDEGSGVKPPPDDSDGEGDGADVEARSSADGAEVMLICQYNRVDDACATMRHELDGVGGEEARRIVDSALRFLGDKMWHERLTLSTAIDALDIHNIAESERSYRRGSRRRSRSGSESDDDGAASPTRWPWARTQPGLSGGVARGIPFRRSRIDLFAAIDGDPNWSPSYSPRISPDYATP